MTALSVLDLVPIFAGTSPAGALADSTALARGVEKLGYRRYWVAEHHNLPGVAVTSPPVLVAHLAGATSTLRVGSGGVMLPNHVPLVVAEQFSMLAALHPGRIDLGLGRAAGTDPVTAAALSRKNAGRGSERFAEQVGELLGYLRGDGPVVAMPVPDSPPDVWLLGSSPASAALAGSLGLPFAFAHHLDAEATEEAVATYRAEFRPGDRLARPYLIVAFFAVAAETDERADWLAGPAKLAVANMLTTGRPAEYVTEETAAAHRYSDFERELLRGPMSGQIVGGPDKVRAGLTRLLELSGADELMALTTVRRLPDRLASYRLLAEAAAQTAGPGTAS